MFVFISRNPHIFISNIDLVTVIYLKKLGLPQQLGRKEPTCQCKKCMQEVGVPSLGWEDPPEREMAAHSSILAWTIPWTEGSGRPQSMGLQRVEHD